MKWPLWLRGATLLKSVAAIEATASFFKAAAGAIGFAFIEAAFWRTFTIGASGGAGTIFPFATWMRVGAGAMSIRAAEAPLAAWRPLALLFPRTWSETAACAIPEGGAFARRRRSGAGGFGKAGLVLLQTGVESGLHFVCFSIGYEFLLFDNLGQCAFDIALLFAIERERCKLTRGGEAVDDIANA